MDRNLMHAVQNDCILRIQFNNEKGVNILTPDFIEEFETLLSDIEKDDTVSVVILTGSGPTFVAGADIKYMRSLNCAEAGEYSKRTTSLFDRIVNSKKIFIAAINGLALGGGLELALSCDLLIASASAKVGLPEVGLGVIPGGGGTQRLPRLIGEKKAKELIFTGRIISAEEAEKMGIINHTCDPAELESTAESFAKSIAKNSPYALSLAKESIHAASETSECPGLETERLLFSLCFSSPEQTEGMNAFLEKRVPDFQKHK